VLNRALVFRRAQGGWFAAWRAVLWARWAMDCSTWAASWLLLPAASAALAVGVARSRQSASNAAGRSRTPSSARLCHALELAVLAALVLHAGRCAPQSNPLALILTSRE
jgi:hypothetical protein